jgi:hypothetical protein
MAQSHDELSLRRAQKVDETWLNLHQSNGIFATEGQTSCVVNIEKMA